MSYVVEFANCNPGAFIMLSGFFILAACAAFHEITFTDSMFDREMTQYEKDVAEMRTK